MLKRIQTLICCAFFASLLFTSCDKKTVDPPTSKTKTELLTTGTWKFSTATVGGADASSAIEACKKDNILTFVSNGTGSLDEGTTKCNSGDAQTNPFTWAFQSNETVIYVSTTLFTGGSNTFNVVSITETQLVVSQNVTIAPGITQNAVVTFIH
jgi:Lipocalin-like domain